MHLVPPPNLEAKYWSRYHTYLVIFLSVNVFFGLFSLVFSGLILNRMALSFSWTSDEILLIFSIIGIGGLFTIMPRFLTDKYGRKPLILITNVIFYMATIVSAFVTTTLLFIIFQIIVSIFGIDLYGIILSEEVPARHRGKAMGMVSGVGMISALLAAFLFTFTGLSVDIWRYLYGGAALVGLSVFMVFWVKMKETRRYLFHKAKKEKQKRAMSLLRDSVQPSKGNTNGNGFLTKRSLFTVFQRKYLKILLLSSLILFLTDWIYLTIKRYFVVFLIDERVSIGFNETMIGTWSILVYIGSILGYYIAGHVSDKIGRKKTMYISILIYFISSILFLFVWNASVMFVALFFINLSYAIFRLMAEILAIVFFPTKIRASGNGWIYFFASISSFIGNFVMYYWFEAFNSWGTMFFSIGTFCLIGLVVVTFFMPETNGRTMEEIYLTEIKKDEPIREEFYEEFVTEEVYVTM